MKKIVLILLLSTTIVYNAHSQFSGGLEHTRFDYKNSTGVTLKYNLDAGDNPNLLFQWNLGVGMADESGFYIRLPGGIPLTAVLSLLWLASRDANSDKAETSGVLLLCLIPALLPNRISYKIIKKPNLSLYLEPITLSWWNSAVEKKLSYAPQAGVEFKIGRANIEAGAIYQANVDKFGFQIGASIPLSRR